MEDEKKENDLQSLLEKYHEEIIPQVTVNDLNMKQVQMDLPNKRHYWVGRLMYHKNEILKLTKQKHTAVKILSDKFKKELPIGTQQKTLNDSIYSHDIVKKIDHNIVENELLVEYLTKIEANFRALSYDIKNAIEIVKLETT